MEFADVMAELEAAGTEQNRRIYARHGVRGPMFGVSYAALGKLEKKIRRDHSIAVALWGTGNHDARVLACKVADPGQLAVKAAEAWCREIDCYLVADAFSILAAGAAWAPAQARKWSAAKGEWPSAIGWNIVGALADRGAWTDDELAAFLADIEARIHAAPNRTRYAMLLALIMIGLAPGMADAAKAAATRIGPVAIDHGETGCKTPEPVSYIDKTLAHRASKKSARAKR
jgi:3-methyladenine DNA glycosylase AlkD